MLRRTPVERSVGGHVSLGVSLLIAHGLVLAVAAGWHILSERATTAESLLQIATITVVYTTPITVLAWLVSRWVERSASALLPGRERVLLVLGWLGSGIVGSLAAWLLLSAIGIDSMQADEAFALVPFLIVNGIIAIIISTFILFFEFVGVHFHRRRQSGVQEQMLTSEFRAARRVQQSLLPNQDVAVHDLQISGAMAPAVEVGGDYYDYIALADGTRGVLVADAAGKGIPAALVMAKFQGMAQALALQAADIAGLLVGLNDALRSRHDRRSFITVAVLAIDTAGACRFFRAGHNPLLHYSARCGSVESICPPGIALGLAPGETVRGMLQGEVVAMQPGDVAVIYSDGLNEAVDVHGREYGVDRVCASLRQAAGAGADAPSIRAALLNDLAEFVGEAEAHDDVTVVVIKRTER